MEKQTGLEQVGEIAAPARGRSRSAGRTRFTHGTPIPSRPGNALNPSATREQSQSASQPRSLLRANYTPCGEPKRSQFPAAACQGHPVECPNSPATSEQTQRNAGRVPPADAPHSTHNSLSLSEQTQRGADPIPPANAPQSAPNPLSLSEQTQRGPGRWPTRGPPQPRHLAKRTQSRQPCLRPGPNSRPR